MKVIFIFYILTNLILFSSENCIASAPIELGLTLDQT